MSRRLEVTASRLSTRAPDAILAQLKDASRRPEWQPEILSARGSPELSANDVVHGTATMLGFHVRGRSMITSAGPDHLEEDVVVGVQMSVRYEIASAADGNGSIVKSELVAGLPGGVMGRLLSMFLRPRLKRMQSVALDRLVGYSDDDSSA